MCPDVVTWIGSDGRRHVSINWYVSTRSALYFICSRSGKNCNHAHSREEVLYHPNVYKTSMCETWNCSSYYCPFAHSLDELVNRPMSPNHPELDEMRFRQLNFEEFWEDNDFDETLTGPTGSPMSSGGDFNDISNLQLRRVVHRNGVGGSALITTTSLESSRIGPSCLQAISNALTNNGANNPDPGWVTLTQGLRVELVVRAISPLTNAELCLATARPPWENAAASAGGNQNRRAQQQASMVVKILCFDDSNNDPELMSLMNQLQSIARSEHKNIISVKKVHLSRFPNGGAALAVAYERCSTSLYTTIADGYRSRTGLPRGLAGRMSPGRSFTPTSAAIGKIGELLAAIHRFHTLGMTHCRICPSNIFIDADANLKLGDFDSRLGLLRGFDNEQFMAESVAVWMAPEVTDCLRNGGDIRNDIDWKGADIYAAGLCIFLALTGQHPYGTFADDDRAGAAGAAASCRSYMTGQLFVEGKDAVLENMRTGNMINQHLLYSSPLALDLVMRMLIQRSEVDELLTHPIFWDFYSVARFITRLPLTDDTSDIAGSIIKTVCECCAIPWTSAVEPEEWKLIAGGPVTPLDFKDTVKDLVRAIRVVLSRHKGSGCSMCNSCPETNENDEMGQMQHRSVTIFVNRMVAKFPAVVVRAWDASRIAASSQARRPLTDAFKRNHLSWMNSRPRLIQQPDGRSAFLPSHSFVREYYSMVNGIITGTEFKLQTDESPEILACIVAQAARAAAEQPAEGSCSKIPNLAMSSPILRSGIDPSVLSSMLNSFGSMMRSDMLPPNVPRSFVLSLIEAAGLSMSTTPTITPSPQPSPSGSGVYYSTVPGPIPTLQLPSGSTTAASSPAFAPMVVTSPKRGSPPANSCRDRRVSSCDGWEYAVACPPTMIDLGPHAHAMSPLEGDEDESPPPGFQTVWQSMADGL
jgi:serine/threonine protein kinase